MERPIQVGDLVRLQIDDQYSDYKIKEMIDNHDILV